MKENIKKFYDFIISDANMRKKVDERIRENLSSSKIKTKNEGIVEEAKKLGYEFSIEELEEYEKQNDSSKGIQGKMQLDLDELDSVSGGGRCGCVGAGGGAAGEGRCTEDCTCVCVAGGGGEYELNGKRYARCVCVFAGGGDGGY